jgi:tRNA pseudouridine32 synthase/23S rRNA pseudouridine746 synthase
MGRQAEANALAPLPMRDGVAPSYLWLPAGQWSGLLAFLLERFPNISERSWRERLARGEVVDRGGLPLAVDSPVRQGDRIWYYREVEAEPVVPFEETILFQDVHILVADKPHFLSMTPGGRYLRETLLVRLKKKTGLAALTPIHRLDRETAGVVIFSVNAATRGAYQSLFQKRSIGKVYEALAAPMPGRVFPFTYCSRIVDGDEFFRMREEEGEPNAETLVDVIGQHGDLVHYRLQPRTGRQHQLRVHMAALGAPIMNDGFYPVALPVNDSYDKPLQLLARSIAFTDPLSGERREFASERTLTGSNR